LLTSSKKKQSIHLSSSPFGTTENGDVSTLTFENFRVLFRVFGPNQDFCWTFTLSFHFSHVYVAILSSSCHDDSSLTFLQKSEFQVQLKDI
jgi:hypothetical protein